MYRNVRRLCKEWSVIEYGSHLEFIINKYDIDDSLANASRNLFNELELTDLQMNGYTIMNLKCDSIVENKGTMEGVAFTDIYHECIKNYDFSPALYLLKVIQVLKEKNIPVEQHIGWIKRAMRTFASFIRETDYAIQLVDVLENNDGFVTVDVGPKQDLYNHVDILLTYFNKQYYIWSYVNSSTARKKLRERLLCNNGRHTIPDGIHLLAPIDIFNSVKTDDIGGWLFPKRCEIERFCYLVNLWSQNIYEYADYNEVKNWLNNHVDDNELKRGLGTFRAIEKKRTN